IVLLDSSRTPFAPIAMWVLEFSPCVEITTPGVLLRLPLFKVAAGATAAVPTAIAICPGGYAAGLVRRVACKPGRVDDGTVVERDNGRRKGDPSGHDAGAAPEE